jgi:hypothetical protein
LTNSLPIGPSKKHVPRVPKNTFDIMRKRTKLLHFQDLSKKDWFHFRIFSDHAGRSNQSTKHRPGKQNDPAIF